MEATASDITVSYDESALVGRAQSGDDDAFRSLVEEHGPELLRLAGRLTGCRDSAEDVVQEALLKAYRALERFDGRSRVGTWLHRIVTNCALDHLRRGRRRPEEATDQETEDEAPVDRLASTEPGPWRRVQAAETRRRVTASLERLTPLERAAFVLRHFEERSLAEIGQILGRPENTAKQTLFRAVQKLRRELSPLVRETLPTGGES